MEIKINKIGANHTRQEYVDLKGHSHTIWDKKLMFNIRVDYLWH